MNKILVYKKTNEEKTNEEKSNKPIVISYFA